VEATQTKPTDTQVAKLPERRPTEVREVRVVSDPIAVLDTAHFEQMQRVAVVMAASSLIPEGLYKEKDVDLPPSRITANCFLVVNQAVRWVMDPFAVAQCVSVIKGKLCYEGKLIAAVIEAKLGAQLEYEISGEGESMKVVVSAAIDGRPVMDSKGKPKTVEGTVREWKTDGTNSPWQAKGGFPRMLRYRGAREWARVHAPGLMLGVYSDDEMSDLTDNMRANRARNVTPIEDRRPRPEAPDPDAPAPSEPEKQTQPMAVEAQTTTSTVEQPRGPDPDPEPPKTWREKVEAALTGCKNMDDLKKVTQESIMPEKDKAPEQDWNAIMFARNQALDRIAMGE
jgi:hypothetical protein